MNIVFVLANPKEGTKYISHMLKHLPDCYACWEPDKIWMKNECEVLSKFFHYGQTLGIDKLWKTKLENILSNYGKTKLYFESDFRFMMLWWQFAPRDIVQFKVVCMSRDVALIARSLSWMGFFTSRENGGVGRGFLLKPGAKGTLTKLTGGTDATQKAIWHTIEMNERKRRFLSTNKHIPVFHFHLQKDRNIQTFKKLFEFLGVPECPRTLGLVKRDPIVNSWMKRSLRLQNLVSIEEIRRRVANYDLQFND